MYKRVIVALLTFIICGFAGYKIYRHYYPPYEGCFPRSPEESYKVLALGILVDNLMQGYEGNGKCLVIHYPVSKSHEKDLEVIVPSIRKAAKNKIKEVRLVPIKSRHEHISEVHSSEYTAEDFNKVFEANSDCDLIINYVFLPAEKKDMFKITFFNSLGKENKKTRFGYNIGNIGVFGSLVESGVIHSMTAWKPNPIITEEPLPEDDKEAFNLRYLLINKYNLAEIKKQYPILFPKHKTKDEGL